MGMKENEIECLKSYLKKDMDIGPAKAMSQLLKETEITSSYSTFYTTFRRLREEIYPKNFKTDSSEIKTKNSGRYVKLLDTHLDCLKKYLKEDICIGNTEAADRLYKETGLKVSPVTVREALIKLEKELNQERLESSPSSLESKTDTKPWNYGYKLKAVHIDCLKKYLSENRSIGYTEAWNRLCKETNLKVSSSTIRNVLITLKKEMGDITPESQPSNSKAKIRCSKESNRFKIKDLHIDYLKQYLKENNFIKCEEARTKLFKETGLEVSVTAIRNTLYELKRQNNTKNSQLTSPSHSYSAKLNSWGYGYKLKDFHINCIKNYLNENNSIKCEEIRTKLFKETGLEVSYTSVYKVFNKFKEEINIEQSSIPSPVSDTKIKSKSRGYDYKLKDLHIECLKKYIKEDVLICGTKARDQLYKETGLEASVTCIRTALINIRKQLNSENILISSPSSNQILNNKAWKFGFKLKQVHVDLLKKYLNESPLIGGTSAAERLKLDTGIEISQFPVNKALKILRREIEQEKSELHLSIP
ncbi:hypothetical protein CONCODRAFT_2810 [Conidiobolus coronatus NRRL 28638]|uniref:Uncharacterized protein n=1 Tax=Conidiobolus coronatus (strain ATCC 28846 / CBS 209.66 / NRRL 28638) TaxID=796925 RepID=A0A137PGH9_CONC2|nr:hypothetical protein CONCODRAFT_2810 [Conidiobolus coronatus NRRL 28638]|eukprot:KXN74106.1 hypothetical protein CONCODRAFT_2810 [Conidiobolus coronatus NRRL 28638]